MNRVDMASHILIFLFAVLSLAESSTVTTFCVKNNTTRLSGVTCPSKTIVVHSVETQKVSSCSEQATNSKWLTSDFAIHLVWLACNFKSPTCTPSMISSKDTYYFRVKHSCLTGDELNSMRRTDLCADVSKVVSTPMYLQSPGYTHFFTYSNNTNCTCRLSVGGDRTNKGTFTVTLHDMWTTFPETITLWTNADRYVMSTKMDPESYEHFLNQYSIPNLSDVHISFLPVRNPQFAKYKHQGYFWMEVKSTANLNISIACNSALVTSTTQPHTTAAPTSLSTAAPSKLSTAAPSTLSTAAPSTLPTAAPSTVTTPTSSSPSPPIPVTSSTGHTNVTDGPVLPPIAIAGGSLPERLIIISIVVPVVLVVIIIIIAIIVVIKYRRRRSPHTTKSDDTARFSIPRFGEDSIYVKENFAVEMIDNDIYQSQDSLGNGSLSGPVSSYGVGVAFGTFRGENANQRSNEDLSKTEEKKERSNGAFILPAYETFGGAGLLGDAPRPVEPLDKCEVVYAEVNKPKKSSNANKGRGHIEVEVQGHPDEGHVAVDDLETNMATEYSLANDFDDPRVYSEYDLEEEPRLNDKDDRHVYFEYDLEDESMSNDKNDRHVYFEYDLGDDSGSNNNDIVVEDDDYACVYAKRYRSKKRRPRPSLHIYDDVALEDSEFEDFESKNNVPNDRPRLAEVEVKGQVNNQGDYDKLYHRDKKHRKEIEKLVNVQRTEL